ncbi:MAG TPA: serine/threonine-protein kinase [Kofleriaceae bacterium]
MTESPSELTDDALDGRILDERYQVEREIGRGAMAVVYRARHVKVGRAVAIKVIHHRLLRTPTMVERFIREAHIAAKLNHRNLVGVLDVGELEDGRRSIVLELANGQSLAEIVAGGPLERERVIAILRQLCDGLEHAHRAGLVHRDLKPENIVVERDMSGIEVPRIIDFGIAIVDDSTERLTSTGMVLGTPAYMAPEQATAGKLDHRTDQYALGVIAYEMLCGQVPFDGSGVEVARANVSQQAPAIGKRAPGVRVDPLLEAIVRKMMAKRPDDRFTNTRAVRQMLDLLDYDRDRAAALLGLPVAVHAIPARRTAAPTALPVIPLETARSRRWWLVGAAAGVAAIAILLALTAAPDDNREVRPRHHSTIAQVVRPVKQAPVPTSEADAPSVPPSEVPSDPPTDGAGPSPVKTRTTKSVVKPRSKPVNPPTAPPTAPATSAPTAVSPNALVKRYTEVGALIKEAGDLELPNAATAQLRFRRIYFSEALRTPAGRSRAMGELDAIARSIEN